MSKRCATLRENKKEKKRRNEMERFKDGELDQQVLEDRERFLCAVRKKCLDNDACRTCEENESWNIRVMKHKQRSDKTLNHKEPFCKDQEPKVHSMRKNLVGEKHCNARNSETRKQTFRTLHLLEEAREIFTESSDSCFGLTASSSRWFWTSALSVLENPANPDKLDERLLRHLFRLWDHAVVPQHVMSASLNEIIVRIGPDLLFKAYHAFFPMNAGSLMHVSDLFSPYAKEMAVFFSHASDIGAGQKTLRFAFSSFYIPQELTSYHFSEVPEAVPQRRQGSAKSRMFGGNCCSAFDSVATNNAWSDTLWNTFYVDEFDEAGLKERHPYFLERYQLESPEESRVSRDFELGIWMPIEILMSEHTDALFMSYDENHRKRFETFSNDTGDYEWTPSYLSLLSFLRLWAHNIVCPLVTSQPRLNAHLTRVCEALGILRPPPRVLPSRNPNHGVLDPFGEDSDVGSEESDSAADDRDGDYRMGEAGTPDIPDYLAETSQTAKPAFPPTSGIVYKEPKALGRSAQLLIRLDETIYLAKCIADVGEQVRWDPKHPVLVVEVDLWKTLRHLRKGGHMRWCDERYRSLANRMRANLLRSPGITANEKKDVFHDTLRVELPPRTEPVLRQYQNTAVALFSTFKLPNPHASKESIYFATLRAPSVPATFFQSGDCPALNRASWLAKAIAFLWEYTALTWCATSADVAPYLDAPVSHVSLAQAGDSLEASSLRILHLRNDVYVEFWDFFATLRYAMDSRASHSFEQLPEEKKEELQRARRVLIISGSLFEESALPFMLSAPLSISGTEYENRTRLNLCENSGAHAKARYDISSSPLPLQVALWLHFHGLLRDECMDTDTRLHHFYRHYRNGPRIDVSESDCAVISELLSSKSALDMDSVCSSLLSPLLSHSWPKDPTMMINSRVSFANQEAVQTWLYARFLRCYFEEAGNIEAKSSESSLMAHLSSFPACGQRDFVMDIFALNSAHVSKPDAIVEDYRLTPHIFGRSATRHCPSNGAQESRKGGTLFGLSAEEPTSVSRVVFSVCQMRIQAEDVLCSILALITNARQTCTGQFVFDKAKDKLIANLEAFMNALSESGFYSSTDAPKECESSCKETSPWWVHWMREDVAIDILPTQHARIKVALQSSIRAIRHFLYHKESLFSHILRNESDEAVVAAFGTNLSHCRAASKRPYISHVLAAHFSPIRRSLMEIKEVTEYLHFLPIQCFFDADHRHPGDSSMSVRNKFSEGAVIAMSHRTCHPFLPWPPYPQDRFSVQDTEFFMSIPSRQKYFLDRNSLSVATNS